MGTASMQYPQIGGNSIELPSPHLTVPSSGKSCQKAKRQACFTKQMSTESCQISSSLPTSFAHKWTITNFSKLYGRSRSQKLPLLYSNVFSANVNDKSQFALRLLPDYLSEEQETWLALFLCLESGNNADSLPITFQISLLDASGEKCFTKNQFKCFSPQDFYGWADFIKLNELLNRKTVLLPDDSLTILCEITQHKYAHCESVYNDLPTMAPRTVSATSPIAPTGESTFNGQMTVQHAEYTWPIDNFTQYYSRKAKSVPHCIESPQYAINDNESLKFHLELYPNGNDPETTSKDYVSLYLQADWKENLNVQFRISILNWDCEKVNVGEGRGMISRSTGRGSSQFINIDTLLDPRNGLLPEGKLHLHIEIEILEEEGTQMFPEEVACRHCDGLQNNVIIQLTLELEQFFATSTTSAPPLNTFIQSTVDTEGYLIQLGTWPHGIEESPFYEHYLSIGLIVARKSKADSKQVHDCIKLSILGENRNCLHQETLQSAINPKEDTLIHLFKDFISHTKLLNEKNPMLLDGKLTLLFEMTELESSTDAPFTVLTLTQNWHQFELPDYLPYYHSASNLTCTPSIYREFLKLLRQFTQFFQQAKTQANMQSVMARHFPNKSNYEEKLEQLTFPQDLFIIYVLHFSYSFLTSFYAHLNSD